MKHSDAYRNLTVEELVRGADQDMMRLLFASDRTNDEEALKGWHAAMSRVNATRSAATSN